MSPRDMYALLTILLMKWYCNMALNAVFPLIIHLFPQHLLKKAHTCHTFENVGRPLVRNLVDRTCGFSGEGGRWYKRLCRDPDRSVGWAFLVSPQIYCWNILRDQSDPQGRVLVPFYSAPLRQDQHPRLSLAIYRLSTRRNSPQHHPESVALCSVWVLRDHRGRVKPHTFLWHT